MAWPDLFRNMKNFLPRLFLFGTAVMFLSIFVYLVCPAWIKWVYSGVLIGVTMYAFWQENN